MQTNILNLYLREKEIKEDNLQTLEDKQKDKGVFQ